MTPTPEQHERSILEHLEAEMRHLGVLTTAHYEACHGMIADAIRQAFNDGLEQAAALNEAHAASLEAIAAGAGDASGQAAGWRTAAAQMKLAASRIRGL